MCESSFLLPNPAAIDWFVLSADDPEKHGLVEGQYNSVRPRAVFSEREQNFEDF